MRFVRQVLEVMVPQSEQDDETVDVQRKDDFKHVCFNVFRVDEGSLIPPSIAKYAKDKLFTLKSIQPLLDKARYGMARIGHDEGTGTCFFLLPNTVITNTHVIDFKYKPFVFKEALKETIASTTIKLIEEQVLFSGKNIPNAMKRKYNHMETQKYFPAIENTYQDPILAMEGDFGFLDVSLHQLELGPNNNEEEEQEYGSKVLFIPCPTVLQIGHPSFTLHYPGVEGQPFSSFLSSHTNYRNWAPSDELVENIFHGFGKLCLSTGKVLPPFVEKRDHDAETEWVPNYDHQYQRDQEFIMTNECVMTGSSGGCVLSMECQHMDVEGITLIEFHGIHFGGEFVKCKNCLRISKQAQVAKIIDKTSQNPQSWNFCSECQNGVKPSSLVYNYAVSVHHPLFKEMYKKLVLPELLKVLNKTINDPLLVRLREYIQQ
ncbi:hypothetical protein C9374_010045 [Naegleria lovaniensis]|uniref:Serine protease n=1 Tax=Naegleria lovaniensis TaxID=51637 RepID=A0AA88GEG0_NAELO|nr:uncharacterized protein C9374_010045 [Naegleria lovaniensis]KAG2375041.1 hypothetical protein C9374_010045 [Naegleria lovaniensis]